LLSQRKLLQRSKFKGVDKPIIFHDKAAACFRFASFVKFCAVVIIFCTIITFLSFPESSTPTHRPNFVERWIWGGQDPRYSTNTEHINWDDVKKVVTKLGELKEHHYSIGLLNFNHTEVSNWQTEIKFSPGATHIILHLQEADQNTTWDSLYPEWIDEEQDTEVPTCPSLPKIVGPRTRLDLIVVKLPCRNEANWSRDVARLHLQLSAANLAAVSAKGSYPGVHLLFITKCFPLPNLFTCKELIGREGNAWLYKPNLGVLSRKLQLPVGSCELALPFTNKAGQGGYGGNPRREAYATILHSADVYVCGAIAAAQSIRMSGSTRDMVILVDETISVYHRSGLEAAGWKIRTVQRIRNPKAEKDAYNEWNYSKFRLWQLTDYDKIIFIDADLLILRNIDFLFKMPEISATGNNGTLFNSGVMVIEPSNCTFNLLMDHINEIKSYNGGDQGYLNEIFTWWHRVPKHLNFLKNFWIGDDEEVKRKKEQLQQFCLLKSKQKAQLEWDRREAEKGNFSDGHWKIRVKDWRLKKCVDNVCNWKGMLRHWGEANWTDVDELVTPTPPAIKVSSSSETRRRQFS
ncbi:UDP-glucuronate:xylan alpha-glucuronosyltransferase 1, partial [Linum perenne]